jgi:hypothetical protein
MNETAVNNKTNLLNQLIFGMGIAFYSFLFGRYSGSAMYPLSVVAQSEQSICYRLAATRK